MSQSNQGLWFALIYPHALDLVPGNLSPLPFSALANSISEWSFFRKSKIKNFYI